MNRVSFPIASLASLLPVMREGKSTINTKLFRRIDRYRKSLHGAYMVRTDGVVTEQGAIQYTK